MRQGHTDESPLVITVPSPSLFGRVRRSSYRFEAGEQYWDNETFKAKKVKVRPFDLGVKCVHVDKMLKEVEEKPICRYCLEEETNE